MDADAAALKEACRDFEAKYGIEAFLDTMAAIMRDRLGAHGLNVTFDDDEGGDQNEEPKEGGGDHRSLQRHRASDC
ncbi:permease [Rhizobium sp. 1AS11]|uniref:permease n=1 Tax=Rhizobium acaciae TaxID=2989736 RepID=UPI0022233C2B|nr:permease [Rhizobium acaciae]MCW1411930.1 permease [Rhizobium acaciae]MCW1744080.1 permease [Rhizobium acaciae]